MACEGGWVLLTRAPAEQKSMAFRTDDPIMSMNSPPSRTATIEVAIVTTPNVRSIVSCGRSKSSKPACSPTHITHSAQNTATTAVNQCEHPVSTLKLTACTDRILAKYMRILCHPDNFRILALWTLGSTWTSQKSLLHEVCPSSRNV